MAFLSLLESESWGGSEHLWFETACRAAADGHVVAASVRGWGDTDDRMAPLLDLGGALFVRVHAGGDGGEPEPGPRPLVPAPALTPRRLHRQLRARLTAREHRTPGVPVVDDRLLGFRPDVLVVNQGAHYDVGDPAVTTLLAAIGCPYVLVTHAVDERHDPRPAARSRLRTAYAGAAVRAFSNEAVADAVERQLATSVAPWSRFSNPLPALPPLPLPWSADRDGTASLAFVGRVSIAKGADLLLDVLARPPWPERDVCLHLYGEVRQQDYLDDLVTLRGLRGRVRLEGSVDDVGAVWARHHLLVLPSRSEGAPLAVAEAMACGRPVVTTAVGGLRAWVVDGETGFLAGGADRHELHRALERAWASRERWPEIGRRAHDRIMADLDPDPAGTLLGRVDALAQRARG